MSSRQPAARTRHAAVGVGGKLFIWAGDGGNMKVKATTLESFNVPSLTWEQSLQLNDSLPDGLWNSAVTGEDENFYSFGGATSSGCINIVYEINPCTLLCREVPANNPSQAPPKTSGSRTVYFRRKLVLYGGYTGQACTNDLQVFDLEKRVWAVQPTTGESPPPLRDHTFTKIDHHRAVVFGGYTGSSRLNDTYILDMETWHWTKMEIAGEKPPAREHHATCCITTSLTGQQCPLLMVIGGRKGMSDALGDVWILDVDKGVWSEVTLPVAIVPRYAHSAVVFGSKPSFRVVVFFGGNNSTSYISDTTLLLLELRGGSWVVTRVVKPDELQTPDEWLKEQMRKLELTPQEASDIEVSPVANENTTSPPRTGGGKADAKDSDSTALSTAHTDSTNTIVTLDLSDLDIGDKKLGKGGFGDVYEGHLKKDGGMTVAVKVTRSGSSAELPQEIKVWNSVPHHQNIIALIGVIMGKHVNYIVTELATNGSLFDYLHIEMNTPSIDKSLVWASNVAHGMKHLHDHNVIHRDLKSANVLLTNKWVAKLCDFGTARELTHTTTTEHAGTYRWMAPEIMRSTYARINKKCDLFSYGMILFELFAHETPYADLHDNIDVLLSVTSGKRPPIPPTLPPYLHDLLKSCWKEDPHLRPTFDDFVNVIKTE